MRLIIGRDDLLDESRDKPVGDIGLKDLKPNAIQAVLADSTMRFVFEDRLFTYQAVSITPEERQEYAYLPLPLYTWVSNELLDWLYTWDDEADHPVELAALVDDMFNEIRILSLADLRLIVFCLWQKFSDGG